MKNLAVISSILYVLMLSVYFVLGRNDMVVWDVYYSSTTATYISLLLLDKILNEYHKGFISLLITGIAFQVLFVIFLVGSGLIAENHKEFVRIYTSSFWTYIWILLVIVYLVTYKALLKWMKE